MRVLMVLLAASCATAPVERAPTSDSGPRLAVHFLSTPVCVGCVVRLGLEVCAGSSPQAFRLVGDVLLQIEYANGSSAGATFYPRTRKQLDGGTYWEVAATRCFAFDAEIRRTRPDALVLEAEVELAREDDDGATAAQRRRISTRIGLEPVAQ